MVPVAVSAGTGGWPTAIRVLPLALPALTYPQLVLTTVQQLTQLLPEVISALKFSAVFSNCLSASLLSIQC